MENDEYKTLENWLDGNQLGIDIVNKKYRRENESFEEFIDRISLGEDDFKRLIMEKKFIPGGRIISNIGDGCERKTSFSNCYVLEIEDDSIESIYQSCGEIARTYSYGGGVGIDISKLRPKGAKVNNSAKQTTGAVSFMKTFDVVTGTIGQNGRRGALMISMDINHPDIVDFVNIKANTTEITNANISIRMRDDFMKVLEVGGDYLLRWPCDKKLPAEYAAKMLKSDTPYNEMRSFVDESDNSVFYLKKINTVEFFKTVAKNNWNYGEPGVLFWDNIKNNHLMSENSEFYYAGVNPCAEEPLPRYGACLLGSMNLSCYVDDSKDKYNGSFDFETFGKDVKVAVRYLNKVLMLGLKKHPLKGQTEVAEKYRQIGLGLFDLAGCFIKMGVRYGNGKSLAIVDEITRKMLISAFEESCDLNVFEIDCIGLKLREKMHKNLFDSSFYKNRIEPYLSEEYKGRYPLNSQILTIAPTGTISTMVNASSGGCEPMFALFYERTTKTLHGEDKTYKVYPQIINDYIRDNGIDEGELEKNIPDFFVTASELDWKERIDMQSCLQKNIDASISSTVNLPEKTTVDEVYDLYLYAWRKGLKGVTVFRENCKRTAILNTGKTKKQENDDFVYTTAPKRPKTLDADFYQVTANGKSFYVFVGLLNGRPYEMFALPADEGAEKIPNHRGVITKVRKKTYSFVSDIVSFDNIAITAKKEKSVLEVANEISKIVNEDVRLTKSDVNSIKTNVEELINIGKNNDRDYRNVSLHVSAALRHGMPIKSIISLEGKCNEVIVSFNSVISRILSKYIPKETVDEKCPDCGGIVIREGGCKHCSECGWSACS